MAWRDQNGKRWNARRPNGWPIDGKAPDGFTVDGFRRVDREGRIRFGGTYWTHDRLKEMPGRMVRVDWGGIPGDYADQRAQVTVGHPDANPENYLEHHSSFYGRDTFLCDDLGDWNKRPVTKF